MGLEGVLEKLDSPKEKPPKYNPTKLKLTTGVVTPDTSRAAQYPLAIQISRLFTHT